MIFGRPPMTSWPDEHPPPLVVNDDALLTDPYSAQKPISKASASLLGFFVYSIKWSDILLEVLKSYQIEPLSDLRPSDRKLFSVDELNRFLILDDALEDWRSQLPNHLTVQAHDNLQSDSTLTSQCIATLCRYLHLKILLFRPAIVKLTKFNVFGDDGSKDGHIKLTDLQRAMLQGCVCSCTSAAQDIVKMIHARCMRDNSPLPNWWYTTFCKLNPTTAQSFLTVISWVAIIALYVLCMAMCW